VSGQGEPTTPPAGGPPSSTPPPSEPPAGGGGTPPATPPAQPDDYAEIKAALAAERKKTGDLEKKLGDIAAANMTEREKELAQAKADAKAEGAAEERRKLGKSIAVEAFRSAAAGKLANVDAVVGRLDMAQFCGDDGEVDRAAITKAVDELAPAAAPAGRGLEGFPAGVRQSAPSEDDWLGTAARRGTPG